MRCFYGLFLMVGILFSFSTLPAHASTTQFPEVMIILDGSGSMWGKAGGEAKISAAKKVLKELVPSLPVEVKLGLTVYGHRQKGNCDDIEIIVPPGSDDRALLLDKVDAISPKGKTPIADSIKMVVDALKSKENETTIILVSDGLETCNPDPCGVVGALKKSGIKFILHVVGFDVSKDEKAQLSCLAEAGGGIYYSAGNAGDLLAAFKRMQQEVVKKVEYEKAKTTGKKTQSRLGKLQVTFPGGGEKSLAHIRIVRKRDDKTIKTAEGPKADSMHPLLAGEYEVILGYANTNYQEPTEIGAIPVNITGGEISKIELGALVFNVADTLKKIPAGSVTLRSEDGRFVLETPAKGNDYYFFTTKPLPSGIYTFEYHYKTMPGPAILARGIKIREHAETLLTIDSGIQIKKHDQPMTGFDLIDAENQAKVLQVRRRWDNTYPLWKAHPVSPGNYEVTVYLKGMDEPLPVGEVTIEKGRLVEFDTGNVAHNPPVDRHGCLLWPGGNGLFICDEI